LTWLSSAAAQDETSTLEHGTRDVRPGRSQTERKQARPWRCDSTQARRKGGGGPVAGTGPNPVGWVGRRANTGAVGR
jgi:hypothetical protein